MSIASKINKTIVVLSLVVPSVCMCEMRGGGMGEGREMRPEMGRGDDRSRGAGEEYRRPEQEGNAGSFARGYERGENNDGYNNGVVEEPAYVEPVDPYGYPYPNNQYPNQ